MLFFWDRKHFHPPHPNFLVKHNIFFRYLLKEHLFQEAFPDLPLTRTIFPLCTHSPMYLYVIAPTSTNLNKFTSINIPAHLESEQNRGQVYNGFITIIS